MLVLKCVLKSDRILLGRPVEGKHAAAAAHTPTTPPCAALQCISATTMALHRRQLPALLLVVSAVAMGRTRQTNVAGCNARAADWRGKHARRDGVQSTALRIRGGRATSLPKLVPAWRGNVLQTRCPSHASLPEGDRRLSPAQPAR